MNKLYLLGYFLLIITPICAQNKTIQIDENLQLIQLQDSVFVHVSWVNSDTYGRFSCNGLVIISDGEAVLVDTPMSNDQTKQLCDYLMTNYKVTIRALIAGHFHNDCIGGIEYLHSIGAKSLACQLTVDKCKEEGLAVPTNAFDKEYDCMLNHKAIICRYWGPGHSFDNITVWLPQQRILYGGCLVKASLSQNLGNLADAVPNEWATTIEKIQYAYPDVRIVVPGHGTIGDAHLLSHTIDLVNTFQMTQKK